MPTPSPTVEDMATLGKGPDDLPNLVRFTAPSNLSGNPVIVLPGPPTDDGLPVTFQLMGRHFDEALLLAMGHAYQTSTGWHLAHPQL